MMKKNYVTPLMEAIELEIQTSVLVNSVKSVDGNGPTYGGGGHGPARAPRFGSWDGSEEDEDEFDD